MDRFADNDSYTDLFVDKYRHFYRNAYIYRDKYIHLYLYSNPDCYVVTNNNRDMDKLAGFHSDRHANADDYADVDKQPDAYAKPGKYILYRCINNSDGYNCWQEKPE